MSKQEDRMDSRVKLEEAMRDYYQKCLACGYDFVGDLKDVIWDATGGKVDMTA